MGKKKVQVTIHVAEPVTDDDTLGYVANCMDSSGCAGCKSQSSQGSKSKRAVFQVYEGHGDEPDIEVQVISPLAEDDGAIDERLESPSA